jgi:hypothetical protein
MLLAAPFDRADIAVASYGRTADFRLRSLLAFFGLYPNYVDSESNELCRKHKRGGSEAWVCSAGETHSFGVKR